MWGGVGAKPLQSVSCNDIGRVAAMALLEPEKYAGRALGLEGDELNIEQAREAFQEAVGRKLPEPSGPVGKAVEYMTGEIGLCLSGLGRVGLGLILRL